VDKKTNLGGTWHDYTTAWSTTNIRIDKL
jgi:hypothetical protein